jgi:choline dehydrogenase
MDLQEREHVRLRLRAVDASIIPNMIGGNSNAPGIMIGEKT